MTYRTKMFPFTLWRSYPSSTLEKLKNESSKERDQAKARIVIIPIIIVYFYFHYYLSGIEILQIHSQPVVKLVVEYLGISFLVACSFKVFPGKSNVRRIFTLITDIGLFSYGMHLGGDGATASWTTPRAECDGPGPARRHHEGV